MSDINYLKNGQEWPYLTVFIDLPSRMVVGWDLSDSLERFSAIMALNKTVLRRRQAEGSWSIATEAFSMQVKILKRC